MKPTTIGWMSACGGERTQRRHRGMSAVDPTETSRLRLVGAICSSLASRKVLDSGCCTRRATVGDSMRRRDYIPILAGAAFAGPFAVSAQQTDRRRRAGVLMGYGKADPEAKALLAE